ncbi:myrosinase 1-like isoform X2 [Planococcus citri]|uniref:myrosinase 1-like isoform X2 n=1 Tax=Planococcus citri TaxID=170843 RepID=UPI0031F7F531
MSVFPDGFLLGVTTSAFQIEGASDEDGKGPSIWDRLLSEQPELVRDASEIGVAADAYHLFAEDVRLIKDLKFDSYKFSISWSRILPNGDISCINQKGVDHYGKLIDELIEHGIIPMVTLYHFDLPAKLQELGGWCNSLLIDYFVDYARLMFRCYGDKVKWWTTFNEPLEIVHGYTDRRYAPYLSLECFDADYIVGHNILKAHAAVYRMYRESFYAQQNGKISIILSGMNFEPKSENDADQQAAQVARQFTMGWFAHPIFSSHGDYPPIMRELIDQNSQDDPKHGSKLPRFSQQEIEQIKGSCDFFALNHYSSAVVSPLVDGQSSPFRMRYAKVMLEFRKEWPSTGAHWSRVVPSGFKQMLLWIQKEFNNPPVYVYENGYCDNGQIRDIERISFYKGYLKNLLEAINEHKCNIIGYHLWTLLDAFEWLNGYRSFWRLQRNFRFFQNFKKSSPYLGLLFINFMI